MDRLAAPGRALAGAEDLMFDHQAFVLAYSGRLQEAKAKVRRAVDTAQQGGRPERAALFQVGAALWDAFLGNGDDAREGARAALELSKARDVEYGAALALALAGDLSQSQRLSEDLAHRFPDDTAVKFSYLPVLRARVALARHEPARALELLEPATANELGVPPSGFFGFFGAMYPVYMRGDAYLAAHRGAEAAAEFRNMLQHRGVFISDPVGALARLQLGRALAMAGDNAGARAAYQEFFTEWASADADLLVVREARAEAARLP
jgi:hypothetical protein